MENKEKDDEKKIYLKLNNSAIIIRDFLYQLFINCGPANMNIKMLLY